MKSPHPEIDATMDEIGKGISIMENYLRQSNDLRTSLIVEPLTRIPNDMRLYKKGSLPLANCIAAIIDKADRTMRNWIAVNQHERGEPSGELKPIIAKYMESTPNVMQFIGAVHSVQTQENWIMCEPGKRDPIYPILYHCGRLITEYVNMQRRIGMN